MKINKKDTQSYLSHVEIKGYKSLKEVQVDLLPGLNVIIGKNGSGKTNFVTYLKNYFQTPLDSQREVDIKLIFKKGKDIKAEYSIVKSTALYRKQGQNVFLDNNPVINFNATLKLGKGKRKNFFNEAAFNDELRKNEGVMDVRVVRHGVPKKMSILNFPASYTFKAKSEENELNLANFNKQDDAGPGGRLELLLYWGVILSFVESKDKYSSSNIKKSIIRLLNKYLDEIIPNIRQHSIVNKVRIVEDFTATSNELGEINVRGLQFEYEIGENWHSFESLSDGTQRVLYILFELLGPSGVSYSPRNDGPSLAVNSPFQNTLTIIEEPELGVHPHQLHLLMSLIKSHSESKQVLVTTHSPQVLDFLSKDELDRLIICELDKKDGTSFRRMTEKEKESAFIYLEDMFLSDYWRHTDFNRK